MDVASWPFFIALMIPSSTAAPDQFTKFTHFSLVRELALASVIWEAHQVSRWLPKLMRGHSNAGRKGCDSNFSHQHGGLDGVHLPELLSCAFAAGGTEPRANKCLNLKDRHLQISINAKSNIRSELQLPLSQAHMHPSFQSSCALNWNTTKGMYAKEMQQLQDENWGCSFPKRERQGRTAQCSSLFFSFLSVILEIVLNVAFERD